MDIPFLCVFIAFCLNYATRMPVLVASLKDPKGFDNNYPRDQQAGLTGWGKRAVGAHQNCFEVFPGFAVAVIIAHLTNADPNLVSKLAIAFIISRVLYIFCYLYDLSTLRTLIWLCGLVSIIWIFCIAIF